MGGTNYGVVWSVGNRVMSSSAVREEREEAVGDEANFKLKLHQLVYDVWYLGWPMLVI